MISCTRLTERFLRTIQSAKQIKVVAITHIDTACVLLNIDGYHILTDPTMDAAGKWYYHGSGSFSRKTGNPGLVMKDLPPIDLILLSHHQHKDNFDNNGKRFSATVPLILSTTSAAKSLPNAKGMRTWESHEIYTPQVPGLKITAMPAQHHPWWVPGFIVGQVIGFIVEFDAQANGVIYISGDTVFFKGIEEIASQYKVDIGIFHLGSVQFRYLTGFGRYTMNGKDLVKAIRVMNPNLIIPVHHSGWTHFKEDATTLTKELIADKGIAEKTLFLHTGLKTNLRS